MTSAGPGSVAVVGIDDRSLGMAANLNRAEANLAVWADDPDLDTLEPLADAGVVRALSPAGAARGRDVVVLRLPDAETVRRVLFGVPGSGEEHVSEVVSTDTVVVDTSPIGPRDARSIGLELERRRIRYLDAAVIGNPRQAEEGTLATFVGGDPETVDLVRPVLECWTAPGRLTWTGDCGSGAAGRLVATSASAVALQVVGEMLRLGRDLGLRRAAVLEMLQAGPLGGVVVTRERRLREEDAGAEYVPVADPLNKVLDDLGLSLKYAGAALPALEGAYMQARTAQAAGAGADDIVRLAFTREGTDYRGDKEASSIR